MSIDTNWSTLSEKPDDTLRVGEQIGHLLKGGEVIELIGDIGSGKTTLVKGIAAGAGSSDEVASPSFTLSRIYRTKPGLTIYHYDFYRLNEAGIMSHELAESIDGEKAVNIIEWAEVASGVLPAKRLTIRLEVGESEEQRRITLSAEPGNSLIEGLRS